MGSDIIITQLLPGDVAAFRGLLDVFAEAFEMQGFQAPGDDYLGRLLAKKDFIGLAAVSPAGGIAGGLTAHMLPSYFEATSEVYLYDLAVKSEFRRQGVGRRLIGALSDYCRIHGFREFFVQADAPNAHALEFYRALGGTAEQVVHYTFNASYSAAGSGRE